MCRNELDGIVSRARGKSQMPDIVTEERIWEMSFELWVRASRLEQTYKSVMWDLKNLFTCINDFYKSSGIPTVITVEGLQYVSKNGGERTWAAFYTARIKSEAIEDRRLPSNDSRTKDDDMTSSDTEHSACESDPSIKT
jgi:hypothetical protein